MIIVPRFSKATGNTDYWERRFCELRRLWLSRNPKTRKLTDDADGRRATRLLIEAGANTAWSGDRIITEIEHGWPFEKADLIRRVARALPKRVETSALEVGHLLDVTPEEVAGLKLSTITHAARRRTANPNRDQRETFRRLHHR